MKQASRLMMWSVFMLLWCFAEASSNDLGIHDLNKLVGELMKQQTATEAKLAAAEAKVAAAEAKVATAESKIAAAESKIAGAEAKMAAAETKTLLLERTVAEQKKELMGRVVAIEKISVRRGVFTARADKDQSFKSGDAIKFGNVLYNLGHDYNPAASVFTCPIEGVYLFQVSIISMANSHTGVSIVKSGKTIGSTYARKDYMTGAVTVFTHCHKNEKVWVTPRYKYSQMRGNYWPVFSGAFLYPINNK